MMKLKRLKVRLVSWYRSLSGLNFQHILTLGEREEFFCDFAFLAYSSVTSVERRDEVNVAVPVVWFQNIFCVRRPFLNRRKGRRKGAGM